MAKKPKSRIGHDPLAWINKPPASDESEASSDENLDSNEQPTTRSDNHAVGDKASLHSRAQTQSESAPVAQADQTTQAQETDSPPQAESAADDAQAERPLAQQTEDATSATGGKKMIVLGAVNDISAVAKLHEQWQENLEGPMVVIDASAVERIDTATLQLLCSLVRDAQDNDVEVQWREPSESMRRAVKLLGLNGPMKLH